VFRRRSALLRADDREGLQAAALEDHQVHLRID
jgi:hypothetical protein